MWWAALMLVAVLLFELWARREETRRREAEARRWRVVKNMAVLGVRPEDLDEASVERTNSLVDLALEVAALTDMEVEEALDKVSDAAYWAHIQESGDRLR